MACSLPGEVRGDSEEVVCSRPIVYSDLPSAQMDSDSRHAQVGNLRKHIAGLETR